LGSTDSNAARKNSGWVDPKKATADYEAAAKATQDKLTALGIKTELVELADAKWII
jgi:hypothetical protein